MGTIVENINIVNVRITHHKSSVSLIEAVAFEIIEQTLVPIIANLRKAATNNDKQLIDIVVKLFETDNLLP